MKLVGTLTLLVICFQITFAQTVRPLFSTDRPNMTEAPNVIPLQYFQIESGVVLGKNNPERGVNINTYDLGGTLLRYGLTEVIELRVSGVFLREDTQERAGTTSKSGLGDISLGAKFHLFEENGIVPLTGLVARLDIPVGHTDFTSHDVIPALIFASAYELTSWASLSYNLGGWFQKKDQSVFIYSLALGFAPLKKIGIFTEVFGSSNKKRAPRISFDLGMTYLVRPNFQLDTSYGVGLTDNALDSFFNFGLSWRLPH